jgi:hypothetical protein
MDIARGRRRQPACTILNTLGPRDIEPELELFTVRSSAKEACITSRGKMRFTGNDQSKWDFPGVGCVLGIPMQVRDCSGHVRVEGETLPRGPQQLGPFSRYQGVHPDGEITRKLSEELGFPTVSLVNSVDNLVSLEENTANSILKGKIPASGPAGVLGVVL